VRLRAFTFRNNDIQNTDSDAFFKIIAGRPSLLVVARWGGFGALRHAYGRAINSERTGRPSFVERVFNKQKKLSRGEAKT